MDVKIASDPYGGRVCGKDCWDELSWRLTLSTMGKPYEPRREKTGKDER